MAMIAMTTSNSIKVNPRWRKGEIRGVCYCQFQMFHYLLFVFFWRIAPGWSEDQSSLATSTWALTGPQPDGRTGRDRWPASERPKFDCR